MSPISIDTPRLTPLQIRILRILSGGASNKDIADELHTTVGTVKVYLSREDGVFERTGTKSRLQAALWARDHAELLKAA